MLKAAQALGESETVRIERDPARAPRAAARIRGPARGFRPAGDRDRSSRPRRTAGLASAVDAFCEGIGFTPDEVGAPVRGGAPRTGCAVKLHAEQLQQSRTARRSPRDYGALSADHLEHADEEGVAAMARAGMVAVLLPGAFYALRETQAAAGRPAAPLRRADGGGDRLQSRHLAGPLADADDVDGLHPVRPDAGGGAGRDDPRGRAGAWAWRTRPARSAPARPPTSASGGSAGRPSFATGSGCRGPSGRIVAGEDA